MGDCLHEYLENQRTAMNLLFINLTIAAIIASVLAVPMDLEKRAGCPNSPKDCNLLCVSLNYEFGKCTGLMNRDCTCYR